MHTFLNLRLHHLQQQLIHQNIPVFLISSPASLTYLTGIYPISHTHREIFIILTPTTATLILSPLIKAKFSHLDSYNQFILSPTQTLSMIIAKYFKNKSQIGIESKDLHVAELKRLKSKIKGKFVDADHIVESLRIIKDDFEIQKLKEACRITAATWEKIQPFVKAGITELALAQKITDIQIKLGATSMTQNFDPIVASGPNSAIPHHTPTNRIIKKFEVVLFDFGCTVNGYTSDFTRTVCIGRPTAKFIKVETAVLAAYHQAIFSISKTDKVADIDNTVNQTLKDHSFGPMIHSTGHGVGLEIHESPSVSQYSKEKLKAGMAITIEPGIYLENKFGYRHENTILITKLGPENLTE